MKPSTLAPVALALALAGCVATVRGPYDTNQCYWTWVDDPHGGYEQLHCWNTSVGGYVGYLHGESYVRRYPGWYSGPRTVVVPPPVGIVRPRGVVVVPPPLARPAPPARGVPFAVPAPH
jgi:hypothetical protein